MNVYYRNYVMKSVTYPICGLSPDLWTNFGHEIFTDIFKLTLNSASFMTLKDLDTFSELATFIEFGSRLETIVESFISNFWATD